MKRVIENSQLETGDPENPPVLKSWSWLYIVVLSELAILIFLFYAFSRYYQ